MLKPITEKEKLEYTLAVQAEKGTDELLAELLEQKFDGYVDIWPVVKKAKNKVVLELLMKKVLSVTDKISNKNATRWHVSQAKYGVRCIGSITDNK